MPNSVAEYDFDLSTSQDRADVRTLCWGDRKRGGLRCSIVVHFAKSFAGRPTACDV